MKEVSLNATPRKYITKALVVSDLFNISLLIEKHNGVSPLKEGSVWMTVWE